MWTIGVRTGAICLISLMLLALAPDAEARRGFGLGSLLRLQLGGHRILSLGSIRHAHARGARTRAARYERAPAAPAPETVRLGSARTFADLMQELGEFCAGQAADLQQWPGDRVAEALEPDARQRQLLEEMRSTASLASDALTGVCRPGGSEASMVQLATLLQEIEFVKQALDALRPPLNEFYNALDAGQRERLAGTTSFASSRRERDNAQPGLALACANYARVLLNWPDRRLDRALALDRSQRATLTNLRASSNKAAGLLIQSCPDGTPTTPPERLDVMRKRLDVIGMAVGTIAPAFGQFYESLSDAQRAKFEQLTQPTERTAAFNP